MTSDLTAIWGAAENDVWVGTEAFSSLSNARLLRFDGTSFSSQDSTASGSIREIAGTATDDVWFTTTSSVLHWDGAQLTLARGATPSPEKYAAIWPRSKNDVWLVGDSTLLRYDGNAWATPSSISGFSSFYGVGVAGSSANDVLFVQQSQSGYRWDGASVAYANTPGLRLLKRGTPGPYWGWDFNARSIVQSADGLTWKTVRTFTKSEPNPTSLAVDADGTPWIGTSSVPVAGGVDGPWVEHFDGTRWQRFAASGATYLTGIVVVGRTVWAVGTGGYAARCVRP